MAKPQAEHCVVIVGGGFAGFNAAWELSSRVDLATEIVLINSADYFLYLPLMPQVGGGLVEPRPICTSLPRQLPKVRFVLGTVHHVSTRQKVVSWVSPEGGKADPGRRRLRPRLPHRRGGGLPV